MTTIDIDGSDLVLNVEGLDKLWAFKSQLRVPLAHVAGVERAGEETHQWFHGLRFPGTNVPGVVTAGTFIESEGHVFWDVHDPDSAIAIRLHDEKYVKLIVEVEDREETIEQIEAALSPAG
jgi:hypothetical protein